MALDIYAGPVSRYLKGDWKNLGQQAADAMGIPYQTMGGAPKPRGLLGRWQADRAYNAWRKSVQDKLVSLGEPSDAWNDEAALPYSTHRPGWEGLAGLVLGFAHRQFPDLAPLAGPANPAALETDPALQAQYQVSNAADILGGCRVWLPGTFASTFFHPFPEVEAVMIGSVGQLNLVLGQVCELWPVARAKVESLALDQPGPEDSWDDAGLYGLSVFCQVASFARENNLPMVQDF